MYLVLLSSGTNDVYLVIFHTISASTTTGFAFAKIGEFTNSAKLLIMFLMFIGGMSFSTTGGIKIIRLIVALKAVGWTIKRTSLPPEVVLPLRIGGRTLVDRDLILVFVLFFLGFISIFLSTFVFSLFGYSLMDSAFEVTSAFSLGGLSVGIVSLSLPSILKLILILQMIIGRTEIIPFLVLLRGRWGKR